MSTDYADCAINGDRLRSARFANPAYFPVSPQTTLIDTLATDRTDSYLTTLVDFP
jgi:hypothetical protein